MGPSFPLYRGDNWHRRVSHSFTGCYCLRIVAATGNDTFLVAFSAHLVFADGIMGRFLLMFDEFNDCTKIQVLEPPRFVHHIILLFACIVASAEQKTIVALQIGSCDVGKPAMRGK